MKSCKVLDCTLRDGAYVLNFRFNESDTRAIAEALDSAGFRFIEVALHGRGDDGVDSAIKYDFSGLFG